MYFAWSGGKDAKLHLVKKVGGDKVFRTLCTWKRVGSGNRDAVEYPVKGPAWDTRPPMCAGCRKVAGYMIDNLTAALWRESQPA